MREALDMRVGVADTGFVVAAAAYNHARRRIVSGRESGGGNGASPGEQPHVRHRVEHRAHRLESLNRLEHVPRQVTEFDFRWMKQRGPFFGT